MTVLEYDTFTSGVLDPSKWVALQLPTPDGTMWSYGDPQAEVEAHGGTVSITVNPFRLKHDAVHMLDDPKHLLVTPQPIPIPASGAKITAEMAYEWGAVNEVLPADKLMDRAWEIARYLLRFSPIVLRHTRRTFVQEFKRAAVNDLGYAQTMELLGMTQFTPYSGGMKPLDRAWNDSDLWKR